MSEYDMSTHHNPDAKVWSEFFMKTKAENNWTLSDIDESLMVGWFANAMMAMHDHLHNTKIQQLQAKNDALQAERKEIEAKAVEMFMNIAENYISGDQSQGLNNALIEFERQKGSD